MAVTETGIKRTEDGGIFCEKCGNDLKQAGSTKFVAHMDGTKFFRNVFACTKCHACLTREFERTAEDAAWWA
jgi:hypothetical protein